jgi:hypothetical protein
MHLVVCQRCQYCPDEEECSVEPEVIFGEWLCDICKLKDTLTILLSRSPRFEEPEEPEESEESESESESDDAEEMEKDKDIRIIKTKNSVLRKDKPKKGGQYRKDKPKRGYKSQARHRAFEKKKKSKIYIVENL